MRKAARRAPRKARARGPRPAPAEQPLGSGMADAFAVQRLGIPARLSRAKPQKSVREIGWAAFGNLARELAARISERFQPDVVLGVAKGGVFVGGALAGPLRADFQPIRIERRSRDRQGPSRLEAKAQLPSLRGKRVLVVDDVAATGRTIEKARRLARRAGASEVQAAVLVVRPGGARPEWFALETDELTVFGWDYQLDESSAGFDPGETGV